MPTALIVGAGIGGLSAAIALRQVGWDVRVFERAESPRELGFGLGLAPNAIAALRDIGVADTVITRGFAPTSACAEVRRPDGTVLRRAEIPIRAMLGGPMVIALRPALHGALLDKAGPGVVRTFQEVTGFAVNDNRVALRIANGETAEGDLLVGADGIGSVVRRALHPDERPPRSSGVVAIRGVVHGQAHELGPAAGVYYLGRGVEAMLARASDTGIYWFLSVASCLVPESMREPARMLAHLSPEFDGTFRRVTGATEEMRFDELVDRDPMARWGSGPVTLLGDAAHPMLPHTGQGAAQAIVDGVALANALQRRTDVSDALRSYERDRQPKTAALVAQGRRTASLMRSTNPVVCSLRDLAVRVVPIAPIVRLFVRINRNAGTDVR
jgi:2-polyprenyl-6-methoxyphenol hydroxylase-like FAD-dependent oxidoreductase